MESTWKPYENSVRFNETEFNKCDNNLTVSYSIIPLLIAVGLVCLGLFLNLSGYRAFRFNLWFSGFNFAFWSVLAICNRVQNLPNGANYGAAFSVGTLAGCISHLLPGVGTFLWGVYAGAVITAVILAVLVVVDIYIPSPIETAALCLLAGGSLCGALILTRHWSRGGLIISTSICGSLLVVAGLDYFIEEWRFMAYIWHQVLMLAPEPLLKPKPCWYSYAIGSLFPIFVALGIFTQLMGTAKTYKQKVERVYVPPTVVSAYGTIRRTFGRSRGEPERTVDYVPAERSRRSGHSRSDRMHRESSRNSRASSRLPSSSALNPDVPRPQRSRDHHIRSPRRPTAQNVFRHAHVNDRKRLLNQHASRGNKHQAINIIDECPPAYDEIFKVVRNSRS